MSNDRSQLDIFSSRRVRIKIGKSNQAIPPGETGVGAWTVIRHAL